MASPYTPDDTLLTSRDVRDLAGGRSEMWIYRRIQDGTLPPPTRIAGRNYWRRSVVLPILGLAPARAT